MFVYTLRANTLRFFGIVGIALIALVSLILFVPRYDVATTGKILAENEKIQYDKIKTEEDRIEFLRQFGWEVEKMPMEATDITVPSEFDKILTSYNEVQKQQGLDITKYKGKTVRRYTYEIKNYPGYEGKVYVNVLMHKNRVIGGDVCSSDVNGFIHGFRAPA